MISPPPRPYVVSVIINSLFAFRPVFVVRNFLSLAMAPVAFNSSGLKEVKLRGNADRDALIIRTYPLNSIQLLALIRSLFPILSLFCSHIRDHVPNHPPRDGGANS